jgi:hypothetical protein
MGPIQPVFKNLTRQKEAWANFGSYRQREQKIRARSFDPVWHWVRLWQCETLRHAMDPRSSLMARTDGRLAGHGSLLGKRTVLGKDSNELPTASFARKRVDVLAILATLRDGELCRADHAGGDLWRNCLRLIDPTAQLSRRSRTRRPGCGAMPARARLSRSGDQN